MKKTVKRIISLVLVMLMLPCIELFGLVDLSPLFEVKAAASEYYTSGYCGEITETNDGTNLKWTIDDEGTLTVTGTGRMRPEAFNIDLRIKTVVIEDGVENVAERAFYQCSNITSVSMPDTVTSVDAWAFYNCKGLLNVDFSDSLKYIEQSAFGSCQKITELILPDTVEEIGSSAFHSCVSLETIEFSDSLKKIGQVAFYGCTKLQQVELPDNLTTIARAVFVKCSALTDVIISDSVTSIPEEMFEDCTSLQSIYIGASVSSIDTGSGNEENNAFNGCTNLSKITVSDENEYFADFDNVIYNKDLSQIYFIPYGMSGELNLPETLTAFSENLYELQLAKNITDFVVDENNTSFVSVDGIIYSADKKELIACPIGKTGVVDISADTESIHNYAFYDCANISVINMTDSVKELGDYCFRNCDGLSNITLSDSIEEIPCGTFYDCTFLETVELPSQLKTIYKSAFSCCSYLKEIELPETLTTLGNSVFSNCSSLVSVSIPDSVVSYGGSFCFSNCSSLETLYIGAGFPKITFENSFLNGCSSLSEVTVSDNNQYYSSQDGILYDKAKTKLIIVPAMIEGPVTIPATVSTFTYQSIDECKQLSQVNVEEGSNYFYSYEGIVYSADKKNLIVCPRGKTGIINIADGAENIGRYAFYNCTKITDVIMPDTVLNIGYYGFNRCSALVNIQFSKNLKKIEYAAFANNKSLTEVVLPDSIAEMSASVFMNDAKLIKANIPESLIHLNDSFNATSITELILPVGLQTFDNLYSSKLKTLTINNKYCEYSSFSQPSFAAGCTIRAYCGSPGHTLAVKRLLNFESIGHTYLDWYTVTPVTYETEGVERRDCAYCDGYEERSIPMLQKDTYTATFVANGEIVATVDFAKGTTVIDEPAVPAKDRYIGEWEDYTLSDSNITINAVYTLIKSSDASEIEADSTVIHYTGKDDVLFKLSASADATVVKSTISNAVPLDIILVVDQSGSMDETLGGNTKKVDALKETALEFVNSVYDNAKLTGCDHRISLVGFGLSGDYNGYEKNENTELLTTSRGIVNYTNITTADYASSLVSANVNGSVNDELVAAINNIGARGATAADLGFEMAKGIFSNTDSTGRQRVVVFMTDGEPTYLSGFQTSVANSAIANAYTLKNAYEASIYSVGVFSSQQSSNSNINKFMNAVSSGYPAARSMTNMDSGNDGEFFTTVNNTDSLSSVFKSISTESLSHTAPFDNITFVKTLSKYVTLTSQQEQTMRVDLIRKYGITNDDIIITRNSDGTTTIEIHSLVPEEITDVDGNVRYVIEVEFFASLNEKATAADDYFVDTEDSGVMLSPDSKGYEVTFDTSAITLSEKKTRVIFTINGEVYEVSENIDSDGYAVAPEIEISEDWTFVAWKTSSQTATNGLVLDATLTKPERIIIWHTDTEDIIQTYVQGDFIVPPVVEYNVEGYAFLSWDRSIPTTMGDENLEFTAVYGMHEHNYTSSVTTAVTCEADGVRTYICSCGDSYTEAIVTTGHNYEAITPSIEKDDSKCTFVCANCGDKYEYALDYQVVSASGKRTQVLYEFSLTDDNLNAEMQPDGEIYIRIPLSEIHGNAKNVTVIRTNDDGTKTQVPAVVEDGFLVITCDHFTPYEVNFDIECDAHTDADSDGWCDNCDASLKSDSENDEAPAPETECNHICHSDNAFMNFIWKIVVFFCKLLGFENKQICECGIKHW